MDSETSTTRSGAATRSAADRRRELLAFLALAVFIWPFIAVGVVAGWGFVVWISQLLFFGPPSGR